jgi:hypothetical protein
MHKKLIIAYVLSMILCFSLYAQDKPFRFDDGMFSYDVALVDSNYKKTEQKQKLNNGIKVGLFLTNNSDTKYAFFGTRYSLEQIRLVLISNHGIIEYKESVKKDIERLKNEAIKGGGPSVEIKPNKTELLHTLNLLDWYDSLKIDSYYLKVEYRQNRYDDFKHLGNVSFEIIDCEQRFGS